jgi:cytochrome c-type biogenesis protein CcmH
MIGQPDTLSSPPPAAAPATSMTASTGTTSAAASDMSSAISSLKKKLEGNPNDADGWLLLGRAYESVERNTEAASALKEAYRLAPRRPEIEIAYAEAMALTSPTRQLTGEPLRMIRHAMESDPSNQDGLWLIGMSDYQGGRYAEAIASWEKIKSQLSPDSDVLESVTKMIADANVRLGGGSLPAADMSLVAQGGASTSPGNVAAGLGPKLVVEVSLPAEQRSRVSPGDTLFVYAKAVDGPPMPIAVQKLKASDLPATVELTDGMGMMPTMNLSQFEQVTVTARISKTGNAITQSGDLQGMSANVRVDRKEPLRIVIDKTAP